ncbi:MAG: metal ABC transporter solute-binding protein, Zn/Mn family [Actinomycetes bacterium]
MPSKTYRPRSPSTLPRVTGVLAVGAALSLGLAACGSDPTPASDADGVSVVTTTTQLGNIVDEIVACGGGVNTTILPIGADPHDFSPSSADVATMVQANVVISNGLGLEAGLTDALASAAEDGAEVVAIAALVDPIPFGEENHSDEDHSDEDHADEDHADEEHADEEHSDEEHGHSDGLDPHFWFDMTRMAQAAVIIGDTLAATGDSAYADCGQQVSAEILTAQTELEQILSVVPESRRVLVTDHDAMEYFAAAYDFTVAGSVIPAGTTLAEPSSADLQALVEVMKSAGVTAIFANAAQPAALADAVAAEVGADVVVVPLFIESLGEPGSEAGTYTTMMLTNAERIADALRN